MAFAWNAWALPFLLTALMHLGAALFIYFVAPGRLLNRTLAVILFFGLVIQGGYALGAMATSEADAYAFAVLSQLGKFVVVPLYLVFLGVALQTPLVRPLRVRAVQVLLLAAAPTLPLLVVARPDWFIGERMARAMPGFYWTPAPAAQALDAVSAVVFVFALVAALSALRRARPGTPARERARWYALAFGTRDAAIAALILSRGVSFIQPGTVAFDVADFLVFASLVAVYLGLLVYAVLKWHLFDLDLQIKWTIRRGTLAAIFLGVFLIVTQLAQNGFATRFGWVWGGIAAALLLLALTPLQRFTERLANAALPTVDGSAEYLAHRRAEIYKGALEEILADGTVTPKERAILERLRTKLGLAEETTRALERDVREEMALDAATGPGHAADS